MIESLEELKKAILSGFGYPTVDVEIDECQWNTIFSDAKRWFRAKKGVLDGTVVSLVEGVTEYDFPDNACNIVDVILPKRSDIQSLLSLGFFDIVPLNSLNLGAITSAFNSYSSYVQILQALETRRRIFGADPSWDVLYNKIHIIGGEGVCASSLGGQRMLVVFVKEDFDLTFLKGRDENLIFRYIKNEATRVLGRIRGKYPSYPAAGGEITTDGETLLGDYKEELERLDEEIAESQGPMGIMYG